MWKIIESDHYIFHFHEDSLAEKEIEEIINIQENCYESICEILKVSMNTKIKYFLCNSAVEVGEIYGDNEACNGFARMPDEIYAVYNQTVKCIGYHEDVHIISYNSLSKPPQNFIREGLAMFFDKVWWGIDNYDWAIYFLQKNKLPNLLELLDNSKFHKQSYAITYPVSGAFTDYIINRFGIEAYKQFYRGLSEDFYSCFIDSFDVSFEEVELQFKNYMKNISIGENTLDLIKKELKSKGFLDLL